MQSKDIISVLEDEFIEFASPVLINNLPSIDGLLPVNRKVLWALHKNKVTQDKPYIKMLRASAMAMSYYIFGDMPLASAMKNMGNNTLNYMYLQPKGSFGDKQRRDGVGASPRYIECRMSKYSEDLLSGINKHNVIMKRNFDNTEDEPIVLPSVVPNILINNSQSIAVGESSKIPSHNFNEVCDSFISYLETNDIDISIDLLNGVDFSTGGKLINDKELFKNIYKTGRGSFTLVGDYVYNEKENMVSITEVPYETYLEDIEDKLRVQYDKGNFKEISDIHDGSDKDGIRLDIYLKKNTNLEQFIAKLRKFTPFESKLACNFTILDLDGKTPVLMSLEDIIQRWTAHRISCLVKEFKYDINIKSKELNKLYGLKFVSEDLDKAISIIRESKTEQLAITSLIKEFKLNDKQSEYISTIRLMNINNDWINKKIVNIKELEREIKELRSTMTNEQELKNIIIHQLEECKSKYGMKRRTTLISKDKGRVEITKQDLVEDYSTQIILTEESYIKKTRKYSEVQKLKEGDSILQMQQCSNKGNSILLTTLGNAHIIPLSHLEDKQPSQIGQFLPSILKLEDNEKIVGMICTSDYEGYVVSVFSNGKISKVPLTSYATKTARKCLSNSITTLNGEVVALYQIKEDVEIEITDSFGKIKTINTKDINEKSSRNTVGITVIKSIREGFKVINSRLK